MSLIAALLVSCGPSTKPGTTSEIEQAAQHSAGEVHSDSTATALPDYIHSEFSYPDADGNVLTIQNSLNKGGPLFGDFKNHYSHSFLVFFMRMQNDRDIPLDLSIELPSDSFAIVGSPDTYMKIFLPPGNMTLDKRDMFNYGVEGLDAFLDFDQATSLQTTIPPQEEYLFYTGTVFYETSDTTEYVGRGGNRVNFFLEGEDLFLTMLPQIDTIRCGHITPIY